MKLKCRDGKVRKFIIPFTTYVHGWIEAECFECGEKFGIHDTNILKPWFKEHVCEKKK